MAVPVWTAGQVLTASDVDTWFVPLVAIKPSGTARVSTTAFANDPDLQLPVAANAVYEMGLYLYYTAGTAGDFKAQVTGPTGTSALLIAQVMQLVPASGNDDAMGAVSGALPLSAGGGALAGLVVTPFRMSGPVTIASTAGTLIVQWAQNTSDATNCTLLAGSMMVLRRVG